MNLVATETGQTLQLIIMDEVRPLRGGTFLPDLTIEMVQRYRFSSYPNEIVIGQPAKFETGVIEIDRLRIPINSLEIYQDGVIVNARHTDDSDLVIDDFMQWAIINFNLRKPRTQIPRRYYSAIIIDLDVTLDRYINHFTEISDVISNNLNIAAKPTVLRLAVGGEPGPGQFPTQTQWIIETRAGRPSGTNRYFSAAPLSTPAHVEMLSALEKVI